MAKERSSGDRPGRAITEGADARTGILNTLRLAPTVVLRQVGQLSRNRIEAAADAEAEGNGMRIAIYQGMSPEGDLDGALRTIGRMLTAAGAAGARMAVFPEVFLPGYNVEDPGAAARSMADWAALLAPMIRQAGCGITIGVAERDGPQVYNAALALDADGRILSQYRKTQLYGAREKRLYSPGDTLGMFDLEGIKTSLLICYDIEFAAVIRNLAGQGVSLILCPTANMMPFGHVPNLTVPAQAVNHATAIAYANYCGVEGDLTYCGGSVLVGADGAIHAQAGLSEALLIADLPAPDPLLLSTQLADFRPVEFAAQKPG